MNNRPRYFVGEDIIIDLDKVALAYKGKSRLGSRSVSYAAIYLSGCGDDYSYKLWREEASDFWGLYSRLAKEPTCLFET